MTLTSSSPDTRSIAYKPQLDGLRFLAVLGVVFYHYSDWLHSLQLPFMGTFIAFFFVLSSYLITSILLKNKTKGLSVGVTAYNFLIRRTLRIFPAYYFYLLLLIFLFPIGGWDVHEHPASYFLYVSNFRTYIIQYWDTLTSHLWTLSVEEQFYLAWPWVILLVPRRYLPAVFYFLMVAGIAFRMLFFALHHHPDETVPMVILTPSCIDGFAYGGLLAWQQFYHQDRIPLYKKIFAIAIRVWLILLFSHQTLLLLGFDRAFLSIGTMILIAGADKGYKNLFGRFLQHPWVTYLGKISYGIYLYHLLLPYVFWKLYDRMAHWLLLKHQVSLTPLTIFLVNPVVSFILYFALTVLFASASWLLLEQPISSLKRYFSYKLTPRPARVPDLTKPIANKDL